MHSLPVYLNVKLKICTTNAIPDDEVVDLDGMYVSK